MNYGRYKVLEELGQGSMGIVYKAHDPNLDLVLAVKVLRPECLQGETLVKRFLAEARVLGRLDHPNIVRVYNVDEDQGTVYIAMEFLEGEALNDLAKRKRLSPEEIADLGAKIAEALGYAHSKGVVHRDVKPGNILVRSDGKPKITDFGIARIEDTTEHLMTQAGEVLGTPAYMSPEQVLSEPADGRSDIFSLGIILYELCAGERPFRGDSLGAVFQAITQATPVPLSERNPEIPRRLRKWWNGACAEIRRTGFSRGGPRRRPSRMLPERESGRSRADRFAGEREEGDARLGVRRRPRGVGRRGRRDLPLHEGTGCRRPPAAPSAPAVVPKGTAASSLRLSTSPAGGPRLPGRGVEGETRSSFRRRRGSTRSASRSPGMRSGRPRWTWPRGRKSRSTWNWCAVPLPPRPSRLRRRQGAARPRGEGEAPAAKAKPTPDPAVQKDLEDGIRSL